ncbi:MAG TPA: nuclear transport factor 2 family protein [Streptosporangiaceae bacterium]
MTSEDVIRAFFAAYSEGRPEMFDEVVSQDYVDYGHTPPGHGPQGARDDYENALQFAGGVTSYEIDALVARDDTGAAAWTGHLPNGADFKGLSLYRIAGGRIAETRHALIGALPG